MVVRLLPQSEWKRAAQRGEKLGDQATGEAEDDLTVEAAGAQKVEIFAADKGDEEEQRKVELAKGGEGGEGSKGGKGGKAASGGTRACGAVVGVVKRNWRPYVCVLDPESAMGSQVRYLVITPTLPSYHPCSTLSRPWARRWNRSSLQPNPAPEPDPTQPLSP